jgi:hypothetical protein
VQVTYEDIARPPNPAHDHGEQVHELGMDQPNSELSDDGKDMSDEDFDRHGESPNSDSALDDDHDQPAFQCADEPVPNAEVAARAEQLKKQLHDHDNRKTLRNRGTWHFGCKGMLLIVCFIVKAGPFTQEQLTDLLVLLRDEDVRNTDLSMVTGRALLDLVRRGTPSLPIETIESTKTVVVRVRGGGNEALTGAKRKPTIETRVVTKKHASMYISPVQWLARFVNNPVQAETFIHGLADPDETHGVQTFNQTPLALEYRMHTENQCTTFRGDDLKQGSFLLRRGDEKVTPAQRILTMMARIGRMFTASKASATVQFPLQTSLHAFAIAASKALSEPRRTKRLNDRMACPAMKMRTITSPSGSALQRKIQWRDAACFH